jgi:hypothetical protein
MSTPDVVVEVEGNETPAPSDDTVVTVIAPDGGNDDSLATGVLLGSLASTVESLVAEIAELRSQMANAEVLADAALSAASNAESLAVDAIVEAEAVLEEAEEIAEDAKDEVIEPDREHWLWKKRGGLKPVAE